MREAHDGHRRRKAIAGRAIGGRVGRRLVTLLAWAIWALTTFTWLAVAWLDHLLRQAGRADLVGLVPASVPLILAAMSAATVGAMVASRRPGHPVGWLLQALGLSLAVAAPATGYANYRLLAQPGTAPAARLAAGYNTAGVLVLGLPEHGLRWQVDPWRSHDRWASMTAKGVRPRMKSPWLRRRVL
jgi:hypothetical protein